MQTKNQLFSTITNSLQANEISLLRHDMLRHARNLLRNDALAEDIVQEALAGAFSGLDGYQGKANLKTWTFNILKNKINDEFRRNQRCPIHTSVPEPEPGEDELSHFFTEQGEWTDGVLSGEWPSPEDAFISQQFWQVFYACLDQLKPNMARVFAMREIQQMEVKEICREVGINPNNCAQILLRARASLAECLDIRWVRYR